MKVNNRDIDILIAQLHDLSSDKPDNQFNAAIKLGEITDVNIQNMIVDELIKALSKEHQALTRAHAAEALGKFDDPKAILVLIETLEDDDYRLVRSYTARALGKMDDPTAIKAIKPLISILGEDEFFGARAEAAEALGKLCNLCKEDDIGVQLKQDAEKALERYQKEEEKRLERKEEEGRSRRVLSEMKRSLKKLGLLIDEFLEAMKNDKVDYAESLEGEIKDEINRMGDMTKP
ncbi:MAG: HEAT repeat domain-containing protein [Methanosarcinales archaeon]|nr:HEAT repeat domain-containing protein [Methanosarcinales archaeon]